MLFQIVYVSSTRGLLSRAELQDLLHHSNASNARLGITGMLLYKDGNVMQVLEGEEKSVRTLFAKISLDPRHSGVLTLLEGPLPARNFGGWSMGFRDLQSPEARAIPGYSEFLNTPLTETLSPSQSQKLLSFFKAAR